MGADEEGRKGVRWRLYTSDLKSGKPSKDRNHIPRIWVLAAI